MQKTLLVVVGPTAVGKTATCIDLAQALNTPILSADSRQCYTKMAIGVAKPTAEEQAAAPHYLIDYVPLTHAYSAGQYEHDAMKVLDSLWDKHPYLLLTGGSGLYIDAVCHGIPPMPTIPQARYTALYEAYTREGLAPLLERLQQEDPHYYEEVDRANPHRVIRAVAVCAATGKPFSFFRSQSVPARPFRVVKIGLMRPRQELYARIRLRVDLMMAQGLWEEAEELYLYKAYPALRTIGYQELFAAMEGQCTRQEAVEQIKRNSCRYAKRQMTWLRRDTSTQWFAPDAQEAIKAYIARAINTPQR